MDYAVYPKAEVTIDLDADEVELYDSGIRPIAGALDPALSEGAESARALSHFEVGDAAARLPTTIGGAIDIGLVESRGGHARRRILIRVWPAAEIESRYAVGSGALFMLGPAHRGAALEQVDGGRVVIVKLHEDRVLGAFELDLGDTVVHGTFSARFTNG